MRWTRREGIVEMAVEIDPVVLGEARAALAAWMNARMPDPAHQTTAESYVSWQVAPAEEFLVFSSPGGYTNQLYLVGHGVVRPFSYTTDTRESALEAARAERDGLIEPEPPRPAPQW